MRIVIEFTPLAIAGLLAGRLLRRRVLLLIESDPSYRGREGRLTSVVKGWLARRAHLVLTNNELGMRYVVERLGVRQDRLRVGPYLTSDLQVPPERRASESRPVRILFANSVTDRKGLLQLVEGLERMNAEARAAFVLSVVGDGEALSSVRDAIAGSAIADRVEFHGRVAWSELGMRFAGVDLVVCPTLQDYRSLAPFEAVNAGLPVVVSVYDGAAPELIASGAAVQVDPLDGQEFARTLERLILDTTLRDQLRSAAASTTQFTADRAANVLCTSVSEVLEARR